MAAHLSSFTGARFNSPCRSMRPKLRVLHSLPQFCNGCRYAHARSHIRRNGRRGLQQGELPDCCQPVRAAAQRDSPLLVRKRSVPALNFKLRHYRIRRKVAFLTKMPYSGEPARGGGTCFWRRRLAPSSSGQRPGPHLDPDAASRVQSALFDRAAADRMLVLRVHFLLLGLGRIRVEGGAYRWVPAAWEFTA